MKSQQLLNLIAIVAATNLVAACSESGRNAPRPSEGITFTPERPDRNPPPSVDPYTGADPTVLMAQSRFPTGLDLHVKVITRTCSPTEGVCHNTKEYPDLHTAANFLAAIDAPCNVQEGTRESIFDRCERPGDRFELPSDGVRSGPIEIGNLQYLPGQHQDYSETNVPNSNSPGLHIKLADPLATDRNDIWAEGRFIRTFVDNAGLVQDIAYQSFGTHWWILSGGTEVVGEVNDYQTDDVTNLLSVGVVEGDPNMNGVYGAREGDPVSLLVPGDPEESYLIARVRGVMQGTDVPGTRMPLANQPLDTTEMLALFCFVEGLPGRAPSRLDGPIDYKRCSYSADPSLLDTYTSGDEVTWSGRIAPFLEVNCGGCHDADDPNGDMTLVGDGAFDALLAEADGKPSMKRVVPGHPEQSYLWLKLNNDPAIEDSPMPTSPLTGWRPLASSDLDDIREWIENGALKD